MNNNRRKSNSYQFYFINARGFTLLEALVATFILLLTLALFSFGMQNYHALKRQTNQDRQIEWHLFLNQMEQEIKEAVCIEVKEEKVTFQYNKEIEQSGYFYYERYQQMIRRRTTNGSGGHLPMLLKVDLLTFRKEAAFLEISVSFTNQERYTGKIPIKVIEKRGD